MGGSHLLLILLIAAVAGQEVPAPEKAGISSASEGKLAYQLLHECFNVPIISIAALDGPALKESLPATAVVTI